MGGEGQASVVQQMLGYVDGNGRRGAWASEESKGWMSFAGARRNLAQHVSAPTSGLRSKREFSTCRAVLPRRRHDLILTNRLLVEMHAPRCCAVLRALVPITSTPSRAVQRSYASSARDTGESDKSDDELRAARTWLAMLHAEAIPFQSIGELTFSRSSGPGGQNVNKYERIMANSAARAILNM